MEIRNPHSCRGAKTSHLDVVVDEMPTSAEWIW